MMRLQDLQSTSDKASQPMWLEEDLAPTDGFHMIAAKEVRWGVTSLVPTALRSMHVVMLMHVLRDERVQRHVEA